MKKTARKSNSKEQENRDAFRALIAGIPEEAFQGHTDFKRLSPGWRLEWLSQAAQFYYGSRPRSGRMLNGTQSPSACDQDRSDLSSNLERTLEVGELSRKLWVAARGGESPELSDEEIERRFRNAIILSKDHALDGPNRPEDENR
jgi:hypothetical protein